jgi:hypothetical protein
MIVATTRREIIKAVYHERSGPAFQGMAPMANWLIRRYIIRPRLWAAGISMSPLKFTSLRFPKPFDLMIKAYRLKHGTVQRKSIDDQMADNRKAMDDHYKAKYRRSRMRFVQFRCHQWEPDGPKFTLLELARQHAGVIDGQDIRYSRIKERYLNGSSGREAIEQGAAVNGS